MSGFFHRGQALQAIVYIQGFFHGNLNIFTRLAVVKHMFLQRESGTAGTTRTAKWKDVPGEDARWLLCLQVSPEEAKQGPSLKKQPHLMKHALDVTANSN